jgi:hypothetical protein
MMTRKHDTVESIRELIGIPPETEEVLVAYAHQHPEDAIGIERVLKFRRRVGEEFERLIRFRNDCDVRQTPPALRDRF